MKKILLPLAAIASFSVGSLSAQTLIDYGGNYVTAQRTMNGANFGDNTLDTTLSRTPTGGSGEYTTNGGPGFFGGSGTTRTGATENGNVVQDNASGFDPIQTQSSNVSAAGDYASLIYFKSAAFSNTWNSANTDLSFTLQGRVSSTDVDITSTTTRFVVQQGSQFYVSDDTFSLVQNNTAITDVTTLNANTTTLTFDATASTLWRTYDPVTSIVGTSYGTAATFSLTSLDAVGWLNFGTTSASATNLPFQVYQFDVVAVPEPTTWALLAGGLTTLTIFRRRQAA